MHGTMIEANRTKDAGVRRPHEDQMPLLFSKPWLFLFPALLGGMPNITQDNGGWKKTLNQFIDK
jgi:hypothetical protein